VAVGSSLSLSSEACLFGGKSREERARVRVMGREQGASGPWIGVH